MATTRYKPEKGTQAPSKYPLKYKRRKRRHVHKHVIAVGFDIFDQRQILNGANNPEPGEPAMGVGALAAPWAAQGDRPLAWVLTSVGRDVLRGNVQLPNVCPNLQATIPQPAHGNWRNPRAGDVIRIRIDPGIYSMFVDDLDCSTHEIEIIKNVRLFSERGNCRFVGGSQVQLPGRPPRPFIDQNLRYTEPRGWSLQPSPVIFGGQLNVPDRLPSVITVSILKQPANPERDFVFTNLDIIRVHINP